MLTIQVIKRNLGNFAEKLIINHNDDISFSKFLIAFGQNLYNEECLYIGTADEITDFLSQKSADTPVTVVSAGFSSSLGDYLNDQSVNMLITTLNFQELCNSISTIFFEYIGWLKLLQSATSENFPIKKLIDAGSSYIMRPLFLFGATPTLMAYNNDVSFNNKYFEQAIKDSYINEAEIYAGENSDFIFGNGKCYGFKEKDSDQIRLIFRIKYENLTIARLVVLVEHYADVDAVRQLAETFGKYIEIRLVNKNKSAYKYNQGQAMFISSLIEKRVIDEERMKVGLSLCNLKANKYYICALVTFSSESNFNDLIVIDLLNQVLPNSHSVIYQDNIIVLIENKNILEEPLFNRGLLSELLKKYEAHIAFSNPIRNLISLSAVYQQLIFTIDFAKTFEPGSKNRLHFYKDFSLYHLIDLCSKSNSYSFNEETLLSLCHPAFFALQKYDLKNGTDFGLLLRTYYQCNCISSEAAEILFLHRNTIKYKFDKIRNIVDNEINDTYFRNAMEFSFAVADYLIKYKKTGIDLNWTEN